MWVVELILLPLRKPKIKKEDKIHTGTNFHASDPFNDDAGPWNQQVVKENC